MSDAYALREQLARRLTREGVLRDSAVENALRTVPRELFAPGATLEEAYENQVIRLKECAGQTISTLSQPAMIVEMLQQLQVRPGDRILEIGTGSGYTTALLAALTGAGGSVTSIDLEADLVGAAQRRFEHLALRHVRAHAGDGADGDPGRAPFDRILLTACATDIEQAWWEQLHPNGRIVLPLSLRGVQKSVGFAPGGGGLRSDGMLDCAFVPMRTPGASVPAGRGQRAFETAQTHVRYPLRVDFFERDLYRGALLWIALSDSRFTLLRTEAADEPLAGLSSAGTCALLQWHRDMAFVLQYGPATQLAEDLIATIVGWVEKGRPGRRDVSIQARRADDATIADAPATFVVRRPATTFFITMR